jgi:protein-tyrosine phosphatase
VFFDGPGGAVVAAKLTKTAFRLFKGVVKMMRVALRLKPIGQAAKNKVSKNKFRYVDMENNFDLDLTYIDTDLVAMGVPTVGFFNTFLRNSLHEVARFFKINHGSHFRVYNACPEMPYPEKPFTKVGGTMTCFQIQDHSPPRMDQFLEFLADARSFKGGEDDNVIAVHCKAGKGRTGSLCCAWLLYARRRRTVEEALEMFAERRTDTRIGRKLRGVETPSQIRYVNQLFQHLKRTDSWLHSPECPPAIPAPTATLHRLAIDSDFFAHPGKIKGLRVLIQCFETTSNLAEPVLETEAYEATADSIALNDIVVRGDVRVALFEDKGKDFSAREAMLAAPKNFNKSKGLLAYFCFHTGFMYSEEEAPSSLESSCGSTLEVDVSEMDKANKRIKTDKRDGRFNQGAQAVLHFSGGYVPPQERSRDDAQQDAARPRVQGSAWSRSRSASGRSSPQATDRSHCTNFSMSYAAPATTASAGALSKILGDSGSCGASFDSTDRRRGRAAVAEVGGRRAVAHHRAVRRANRLPRRPAGQAGREVRACRASGAGGGLVQSARREQAFSDSRVQPCKLN